MFNHIMVGSNDIERSRRFYDPVLRTLGASDGVDHKLGSGHHRLLYPHNGSTLVVTQPINDEPATYANGGTIAFKCTSPEQVQQFHDVAVGNGGLSIPSAPGRRDSEMGAVYLSYVRDPDGNKLCAIHMPGG